MRCALAGSGSSGNALLVAAGNTRLLVDCGYSVKALEERLQDLELAPDALDAILVTHEHDDHLGGVLPLARRYGLPVYWTRGTALAARERHGEPSASREFSAHAAFRIGDIDVQPVPVPHDAREAVQFVFSSDGQRLGLLTDLGAITPHVLEAYAGCDALCLEFNHDPTLLQSSAYPASLKRRIAGDYGHLSNAQSTSLLSRLDRTRLKHVIAAHLSERTNHPDLVAQCLDGIAPGFRWEIARQDVVLPWFEVG